MVKKGPFFVFVTGGVISGLGKGITAASMGLLLKSAGLSVRLTKADMYLNQDAGTMNPLEHGETFVTADGMETDQDLGHYERFLDVILGKENYFTMGQVYGEVLNRERRLEYGGKCVEGHLHIPAEIIRRIKATVASGNVDVSIIEVGGTVGEYQNVMFFESIRRLKQEMPSKVFLIHVVYLPVPHFLGEMKSKPAQASVYDLYQLGLQPDFLVCRSDVPLDDKRRKTLAFNTGIKNDHIITNPDVETIYMVPVVLKDQDWVKVFLSTLGLRNRQVNLSEWMRALKKRERAKKSVKVAIVGKYQKSGDFELADAYVSVVEAIKHAAWSLGVNPEIVWIDSEAFSAEQMADIDAMVVPGGWGSRGVEGMIKAVNYARENKIAYLGLCYGMQMAVIEYARNVLGLKEANTVESNPDTPDPVVHIMPDQVKQLVAKNYGGTLRLGQWPCQLKAGSIVRECYKEVSVLERHRHRYEFNNEYRERLEKAGLTVSGESPDGRIVEAVELPKQVHPFFVGVQFHPELQSRFLHPHPVFVGLLKAAVS